MDDPQAVFYILYIFSCYKIALMYDEIEYVLQQPEFSIFIIQHSNKLWYLLIIFVPFF